MTSLQREVIEVIAKNQLYSVGLDAAAHVLVRHALDEVENKDVVQCGNVACVIAEDKDYEVSSREYRVHLDCATSLTGLLCGVSTLLNTIQTPAYVNGTLKNVDHLYVFTLVIIKQKG